MALPVLRFSHRALKRCRRLRNGRLEVLVGWEGLSEEFDTWEPAESIPVNRRLPKLDLLPLDLNESIDDTQLEENHFNIEKLLCAVDSPTTGETQILIKWEHYSADEASWEPLSNIVDRESMLVEVEEARRRYRDIFTSICDPQYTHLSEVYRNDKDLPLVKTLSSKFSQKPRRRRRFLEASSESESPPQTESLRGPSTRLLRSEDAVQRQRKRQVLSNGTDDDKLNAKGRARKKQRKSRDESRILDGRKSLKMRNSNVEDMATVPAEINLGPTSALKPLPSNLPGKAQNLPITPRKPTMLLTMKYPSKSTHDCQMINSNKEVVEERPSFEELYPFVAEDSVVHGNEVVHVAVSEALGPGLPLHDPYTLDVVRRLAEAFKCQSSSTRFGHLGSVKVMERTLQQLLETVESYHSNMNNGNMPNYRSISRKIERQKSVTFPRVSQTRDSSLSREVASISTTAIARENSRLMPNNVVHGASNLNSLALSPRQRANAATTSFPSPICESSEFAKANPPTDSVPPQASNISSPAKHNNSGVELGAASLNENLTETCCHTEHSINLIRVADSVSEAAPSKVTTIAALDSLAENTPTCSNNVELAPLPSISSIPVSCMATHINELNTSACTDSIPDAVASHSPCTTSESISITNSGNQGSDHIHAPCVCPARESVSCQDSTLSFFQDSPQLSSPEPRLDSATAPHATDTSAPSSNQAVTLSPCYEASSPVPARQPGVLPVSPAPESCRAAPLPILQSPAGLQINPRSLNANSIGNPKVIPCTSFVYCPPQTVASQIWQISTPGQNLFSDPTNSSSFNANEATWRQHLRNAAESTSVAMIQQQSFRQETFSALQRLRDQHQPLQLQIPSSEPKQSSDYAEKRVIATNAHINPHAPQSSMWSSGQSPEAAVVGLNPCNLLQMYQQAMSSIKEHLRQGKRHSDLVGWEGVYKTVIGLLNHLTLNERSPLANELYLILVEGSLSQAQVRLRDLLQRIPLLSTSTTSLPYSGQGMELVYSNNRAISTYSHVGGNWIAQSTGNDEQVCRFAVGAVSGLTSPAVLNSPFPSQFFQQPSNSPQLSKKILMPQVDIHATTKKDFKRSKLIEARPGQNLQAVFRTSPANKATMNVNYAETVPVCRSICGEILDEPRAWTEHRVQSKNCVQKLSKWKIQPLGGTSNAYRCFCHNVELMRDSEWGKVSAYLREHFPLEVSNGIVCKVCNCREHAVCSLFWLKAPLDYDEISTFIKGFLCIPCRTILLEPFASVDRIMALVGTRFRTMSGNNDLKLPITLEFQLTSRELSEISAGRMSIQIRGSELTGLTYKDSGFPPQVIFKILGSQEPFCVLKPPGLHRKRKEEPRNVPKELINSTGVTKIRLDCTFGTTATSPYLLTAVLVRHVNAVDIFTAAQAHAWLPMQRCRAVCKAISAEALLGRTEEDDDVVMERTDTNALSLRCPSTLMRIGIPARGYNCKHIQCFDLEFYVHSQTKINSHKNRWLCPVCYKRCFPHELLLDSYIQEILHRTSKVDLAISLSFTENKVSWEVKQKESGHVTVEDQADETHNSEEVSVINKEILERQNSVALESSNARSLSSRAPVRPTVIDLD